MPKNNFFNHLVGFSFSEKRFAKLLKFLLKNAREREREREREASNKERVKWNKKSPTIHWCESNVRAIVGIRPLPLFTGRHKNALLLCLVIYVFSGS
jgi:hypothetical protein